MDRLADEVELQRLCSMGILARAGEEAQKVTDKLTTKLVYDWRLKTFVDENGVERKRSSSTHILNLLRLMYLHKCGERDAEIKADSTCVFGCERCVPYGSSRQTSENQSWKGGVPG